MHACAAPPRARCLVISQNLPCRSGLEEHPPHGSAPTLSGLSMMGDYLEQRTASGMQVGGTGTQGGVHAGRPGGSHGRGPGPGPTSSNASLGGQSVRGLW